MWRPSDTILDEPPRIWILLVEDCYVFLGVLMVTGLWMDTLLSLGVALGSTWLLVRLKRGHPPGVILHRLHTWGYPLIRIPGVLPPRPTTYSAW